MNNMRITILTCGSRGDVQPYLALGKGLLAAGHSVRIATHASFEPAATAEGLEFAPLSGDPQTLLASPDGKLLLEHGDSVKKFLQFYGKLADMTIDQVAREAHQACEDADVILSTTNILFVGEMVAEKLKKPVIYASTVPFAPSWRQPGIGHRRLPWWAAWWMVPCGHYRTMSIIGLQVFSHYLIEQCNRARKNVLGLPPRSRWLSPNLFRNGPLFLYNYSTHVSPRPADWAPSQHVTGFWFLDRHDDWQPPPRLVDFLQAGPPPVCVGFGSMTPQSPEELARLVAKAVKQSGQRGIILSGWAGLTTEDMGDEIFVINAVPHDWLFPRVSAVVHHGGAGTTAAGLRAGKPTVIVPFLADQPYWGRRVAELGAGPKPIPKWVLTPQLLSDAIGAAVKTPSMRQRAEEIGAKIRGENGVKTAVEIIEREMVRWFGSRAVSRPVRRLPDLPALPSPAATSASL
jgi:UDP:flavonoid glycosyltransferase YjiC (YdhE family)